MFKKTQDCLQHQPGWTDGSILTKVLEGWPKGFWYGVSSTKSSTRLLEKLSAMAQSSSGSFGTS